MKAARDALMDDMRRRFDFVIGLFIRHGDYRTWQGGRFFHPLVQYEKWAHEMVSLYSGSRVGVLVTSDEPVPDSAFRGLPVEFATGSANRGGHWFGSFLQLAACDVIVSPPSTFSACAAFLGNRPIWPILNGGQQLASTPLFENHLFEAARDPIFSVAVR